MGSQERLTRQLCCLALIVLFITFSSISCSLSIGFKQQQRGGRVSRVHNGARAETTRVHSLQQISFLRHNALRAIIADDEITGLVPPAERVQESDEQASKLRCVSQNDKPCCSSRAPSSLLLALRWSLRPLVYSPQLRFACASSLFLVCCRFGWLLLYVTLNTTQTNSETEFDYVIIGSGIGGLSTAALLRW
jgi:hypothetical protein